MKFNCGPTLDERFRRRNRRRKEWHPWFAWHPVRVGPEECRWLETVMRRGEYDVYGFCWVYEYRVC